MDNNTKVMLSGGELAMANNKNAILIKQAIITKAASLFTVQIPIITNLFTELFVYDETLLTAIPKISKGENYNGFPYVMLDFPSTFSKENIFAVRTMFWWGNFISITLHLKGLYKNIYADNILKKIHDELGFYISTGEDEWQHHFEEDNFTNAAQNENVRLEMQHRDFLKVGLKYELHHWNMMQTILPEGYNKIKNLLVD